MLGHNLIPTPTSNPDPSSTHSGIGSIFSTIAKNITDEINGIGNDIADKLAAELGISQWYSLHLMDACEGSFTPNATTPGAGYNVTNCTTQAPTCKQ